MAHTASKKSPKPSKTAKPAEDVVNKRPDYKPQFPTKSRWLTTLLLVVIPFSVTGMIFGAMAMCCIMMPDIWLNKTYIGYFTWKLVQQTPFAIAVIFNLSTVGIFATVVYFRELSQEQKWAEEDAKEAAEAAQAKSGKAVEGKKGK
mmetsp:Transcript_22896/g.68045  ORF Transcript_22896/g.68045 Transcript_22896/m.68045 type:complete len:146 (-) Transcript_22896:165-602(-)